MLCSRYNIANPDEVANTWASNTLVAYKLPAIVASNIFGSGVFCAARGAISSNEATHTPS